MSFEQYLKDTLSENDIIELWNRYCQENHYNDEIHSMCSFDELFQGASPTSIIRNASDNFNINDEYFYISDLDHHHSFNNVNDSDCPISMSDLADWLENIQDYIYDEYLEENQEIL